MIDGTDDALRNVPLSKTSRGRKKALAGKAGVSTRTLRRMEKGEAVSEETRRRVEAAVGRMNPEMDPLREAHVEALKRMADASTREWDASLGQLWDICALLLIGLVPFVELTWFYYNFKEGWDLLVSPWAIAVHTLAVLTLAAAALFLSLSVRAASSHEHILSERRRHIPLVVEGIRHGSIKCLGEEEATFLRHQLGGRKFRDVIEAAPKKVQLL